MKIIKVYEKSSNSDRFAPQVEHLVQVDDDDYEALMQYSWTWRDGYAARKNGKSYYQLHRQVMGVFFKEPIIVDHKDNDHHNCQKYNLRRADRFQNQQNRLTNKGNTLPKGIQLLPSGNFRVRVQGWNKRVTVGTYPTQEEAINARNEFAQELHKEFFRPSHEL